MEHRPIFELNVFASMNSAGVVVHDLSEWVVKERLEVHDRDFHDDMQGNKMDDRILNFLLVRQNLDVNEFTVQSHCAL